MEKEKDMPERGGRREAGSKGGGGEGEEEGGVKLRLVGGLKENLL